MWEMCQVCENSHGELGITKKLFTAWPSSLAQGFCYGCGGVVVQERRFPSVDGRYLTKRDIESWLAHLAEVQQGQSRPSVWPWVLTGLPQKQGPKHLQLLLWFGISLAMALAHPSS